MIPPETAKCSSESYSVAETFAEGGARWLRDDFVRQRLAHAHHLLHEAAVDRETGQHGEYSIPAQEVVIDTATHESEHARKHSIVCRNHAFWHAHDPAEFAVHTFVNATRERIRKRSGNATVAFRDIAVVPQIQRAIGIW